MILTPAKAVSSTIIVNLFARHRLKYANMKTLRIRQRFPVADLGRRRCESRATMVYCRDTNELSYATPTRNSRGGANSTRLVFWSNRSRNAGRVQDDPRRTLPEFGANSDPAR